MEFTDWLSSFERRDWQYSDDIDTTRFALIGLGWWTRDEAIPALETSAFCEPTVVVSGSPAKAQQVAAEHETIESALTYEQFHDGAATGEYDAVYICTPNATHLEYAETAATLGKDVLSEKPMEVDSDRAQAMVDVCEEAKTRLMIAYRMHTEPAVRRARELIDAGFVGNPVTVIGHMSDLLLSIKPDFDQWRLDSELAGGCSLIDIGIYPLNTTRFVLDADPITVHGITRSPSEPFEGVDERIAFHAEFPDGVLFSATASHNAVWNSQFKVVGTEGSLCIEPAFAAKDDRKMWISRGGTRADHNFEQVDQMEEEFDYFAHCRATDTRPVATGEHGLVDMKVIEAIYKAADTGRRIEV